MTSKKLNFKQIIILLHIFIVGTILYIILLENKKYCPELFKIKYSNTLMLTKSLATSIRNNDFASVKHILDISPNKIVDIENSQGISPLLIGIQTHCNNQILEILINHSNKKWKNKFGETAMHFSIMFFNYEAFKMLLKNNFSRIKYKDKTITELIYKTNDNLNKNDLKNKFLILWNNYSKTK